MANQLGELVYKITGDSKGLEKSVKKSGGLFKKLKTNWLAVTAALAGYGLALKSLVSAYAVQEKADVKLRRALKNTGDATKETFGRFKNFASELQGITTVGDETTEEIIALGLSMGQTTDTIEAATKGAIGLSKSFGIDANTAMRALTNATQGNFSQLERYIPAIRSATTEAEKQAAVNKAVADGFKFATDEAKSNIGSLEQVGNTIGDVKEDLGKFVAVAIIPVAKAIGALAGIFTSMPDGIGKTSIAITTLAIPAVIALNAALGPVGLAIAGISAGLLLSIGYIKTLKKETKGAEEEELKRINSYIKKEQEALEIDNKRLDNLIAKRKKINDAIIKNQKIIENANGDKSLESDAFAAQKNIDLLERNLELINQTIKAEKEKSGSNFQKTTEEREKNINKLIERRTELENKLNKQETDNKKVVVKKDFLVKLDEEIQKELKLAELKGLNLTQDEELNLIIGKERVALEDAIKKYGEQSVIVETLKNDIALLVDNLGDAAPVTEQTTNSLLKNNEVLKEQISILGEISGSLSAIAGVVDSELASSILNTASTLAAVGDDIKNIISDISDLAGSVGSAAKDAGQAVGSAASDAGDVAKDAGQAAGDVAGQVAGIAGAAIKAVAAIISVFKTIADQDDKVLDSVKKTTKALIDQFDQYAEKLEFDAIKKAIDLWEQYATEVLMINTGLQSALDKQAQFALNREQRKQDNELDILKDALNSQISEKEKALAQERINEIKNDQAITQSQKDFNEQQKKLDKDLQLAKFALKVSEFQSDLNLKLAGLKADEAAALADAEGILGRKRRNRTKDRIRGAFDNAENALKGAGATGATGLEFERKVITEQITPEEFNQVGNGVSNLATGLEQPIVITLDGKTIASSTINYQNNNLIGEVA